MDKETRTLISRAQVDDPDAIDELFRRYRDRLQHAIRKLLGARYRAGIGDSDDAVQDAILAAFSRLDAFDYRGDGSFLAWLLKSADFEVRNRLRGLATRKRDADRVQPLDDAGNAALERADSPSEVVAQREDEDRIVACLERLPEREREAIILRRYLDLEMTEICQELDLPSPGAARALLSRAQTRLAAVLSSSP